MSSRRFFGGSVPLLALVLVVGLVVFEPPPTLAAAANGDPTEEMFFYRSTNGSYRYYDIESNASLGTLIRGADSGYSLGWDSITAVDLDGDGQDEMFFYKSHNGAYRYYNVQPDASLGALIRGGDSGYSLGWDSITAVDLDGDGQDEMFFYKSHNGSYRYYNIQSNGIIGNPIHHGDGYTAGWSSITAVGLDGNGAVTTSPPTTNAPTTTAAPAKMPPTTTAPPATVQVPAGDVDGLLQGRLGFGGKVTGGAGGRVCVVSSLADSGSGSLRECAESAGATWIQFGVSGEIALGSEIEVASDKTIDGRGAQITVRGKLEMSGVHNVVIHNIQVTGSPEDAIQIKGGSSNIWLDHLDLSNSGDGLIDITQGSTDVTVSWTRFSNHDKVMLLGIDGDDTQPPQVTIHHCFFDGTGQRHPRLRFGKVHMFNNYLRNWYHYGVASSDGGQTLSEANIYQAGSDPRAVLTHMGDDAQEGMVRSTGDLALNGAIINQRAPESVFTPPYGYHLDPATTTLANTIAANAGTG